jgi:hypothetical protein
MKCNLLLDTKNQTALLGNFAEGYISVMQKKQPQFMAIIELADYLRMKK